MISSDDIKSLVENFGIYLEYVNGSSDDFLATFTQTGSVNELNADNEQESAKVENVDIKYESKFKTVAENVEKISSEAETQKKKIEESDQNGNFEIGEENSEKLNGLNNNGNKVSVIK